MIWVLTVRYETFVKELFFQGVQRNLFCNVFPIPMQKELKNQIHIRVFYIIIDALKYKVSV